MVDMGGDTTAPRVELFVRSLATPDHPAVASTIDRLERLSSAGAIADTTVTVWGERIEPRAAIRRTAPGTLILDRLAQFEDWSSRNGLTLEPFFEERVSTNRFTSESHTTYVLPSMAAAELQDETLVRMSPCSDGETTFSVPDLIDHVEGVATVGVREGRPAATPFPRTPEPVVRRTTHED